MTELADTPVVDNSKGLAFPIPSVTAFNAVVNGVLSETFSTESYVFLICVPVKVAIIRLFYCYMFHPPKLVFLFGFISSLLLVKYSGNKVG